MIPKELRRGPGGMTRLDRIREADALVRKSRFLAEGAKAERRLTRAAVERVCVWLAWAATYYRMAGLTLLAERIDQVRESTPDFAWAAFDQANAHEEL